ncbi:MAG: hypothetical protein ACT4QF_05225 [Sporichthyaceae bacterium]
MNVLPCGRVLPHDDFTSGDLMQLLLVLAMLVTGGLLVAVAARQESGLAATVGDPRIPRPDDRPRPVN